MSRTIITHPDGSRTTVTKQSGCGGCFWALLGVFVVFAPGAWAANGTIPVAVAVAMYLIEAVVFGAGFVSWTKRRQVPGVVTTAQQQPPPPPQ